MFTRENVQETRPPALGIAFQEDTFAIPRQLFPDRQHPEKIHPDIQKALDYVTRSYLFYIQAAAQYADKDWAPNMLVPLLRKLEHTNDVIRITVEMLENSKELNKYLKVAVIVAILHDWLRAFQGWFFGGEYSDGLTEFYHGEEAAVLLEKIYGVNHPITIAVKGHGMLKPINNYPPSLIIKDVDKIAILLRVFELNRQLRQTHAEVLAADYLQPEVRAKYSQAHDTTNEVHPELIKAMHEKRLGLNKHRVNEVSEYFFRLLWLRDFNYQEARLIVVQERLPEQVANYIAFLQPKPEIMELVYTYIAEWYREFNLGEPDYTLQSVVDRFTQRWGYAPIVPKYLLKESDQELLAQTAQTDHLEQAAPAPALQT